MKPLSKWYDNFDENGKRKQEEVTVEYMNVYSKALVELFIVIPKSVYEILDTRRLMACKEEDRLKEYVLVELCLVIAKAKMDRVLKVSNPEFSSKARVNKIMIGKIYEVAKDTKIILRTILLENKYEVVPEKTKDNLEAVKTKDDILEDAPEVNELSMQLDDQGNDNALKKVKFYNTIEDKGEKDAGHVGDNNNKDDNPPKKVETKKSAKKV